MITTIITSNASPHMVVPFPWFLYTENSNSKQGIVKGYRKQLRHFKHREKHKIIIYPKYLLIFTTYHVQGLCTMILFTLKYQPDVRHVKEIIIKISWYTHLKHTNPYIFILQSVNNPSNGFLLISSLPQPS